MRIALVTLYDNKCFDYAKYSDISKKEYCKKFGYDFVLFKDLFYKDRHPVWSKIPAVLKIIKSYDYVFWVDADAIISNLNFNVSTLFDDRDIYISKDINGYNFGIFAVKNSKAGIEFLMHIDASYIKFRKAKFKEQSAASHFIEAKFLQQTKEIPAKKWNCYDDVYSQKIDNIWEKGDFILHLPAENLLPKTVPPYRVKRFTEILDENKIIYT